MMTATPISLPEPTDDIAESLAALPLFQDLSDAILDNIRSSADVRRYEAGQTVYSLGQYDGGEFFAVLSGSMRVSVIDSETGAMLIEEIRAGTIFAMELALCGAAGDAFQQISVTAEDDLSVLAIDAEAFSTLAAHRPSLMRNVAVHFAGELAARRFKNMIAEAGPAQRVFSALVKFIERDGVTGEWRIPRMPKHRELADEAGVDEADAAGAVATLIQEGIARRDYPGLVIDDMSRINELAG